MARTYTPLTPQSQAARALRVAMTRAEAHLRDGDQVAAMETLERGVETANKWLCVVAEAEVA